MLYLVCLILILLGLIFCVTPYKTMTSVLSVFSFSDFGIRKIKRWRNTTDTLGNFFIVVSAAICLSYIFYFKYFLVIYGLWMLFTLLCTLSRVFIMTKRYTEWKRLLLIVQIYAFAAVGLLCVSAVLFHSTAMYSIPLLAEDIEKGRIDFWYIFLNPSISYALLQGLIMLVPLFELWQQFKCMRLDNRFRGYNLATMTIHTLIVLAGLIFISLYGFNFIDDVYQVQYKQLDI